MCEVTSFSKENTRLFFEVLKIRTEVFIQEQGVNSLLEYDDDSQNPTYYLLKTSDGFIATCRYRKTNIGIKIERFAVLKMFRNKGYGMKLMDVVLRDLSNLNLLIYLHAQISSVNFYKKYGFVVSGDVFQEAGIDHFTMKYTSK